MKNVVAVLFLFISISAFSQDPFLQKSSPEVEKEAKVITNKYLPELGMTGQQVLLFQQKVAEFLIRKNKIETELNGKEKLNALYKLQVEETAEMNDILTQPQMEVYKKVKPKFQPLEKIETE